MIVPDVNVLIYAHDSSSPWHKRARAWWESCLAGSEAIGVPWVVVLAFVRLVTHPSMSENPMTVLDARACVQQWLESGQVRLLAVGQETLGSFFDLLEADGIGGNLTTDALIAATAYEHGGCVYSNDRDFDRFPGLRWKNPLQA